ncbi:MAG TPA: hypothetical protein VH142_02490 [Polyangiaceae bacterium]|nr:hypothetical protein [Polyangiaceae bacterium]
MAALATAAFVPALAYGYAYDDLWTVENNPALDRGLGSLLGDLLSGRGAAHGVPDATRPIMVASLWLDRRLFGHDPSGFHLHSLALYAACTAASVLAIFAITRRWRSALVGGAFFAAAPVHAEVVAAVNYREDLQSALAVFGVLACLFWPRRAARSGVAAFGLAALVLYGLLAKENAVVVLPLVVAVAAALSKTRALIGQNKFRVGAVLVTTLAWGTWRAVLRATGRDDVPLVLAPRGLVERLARTARYLVRATRDGIVPFHWAPDYAPEPAPSIAGSIAWSVALVAIVVVAGQFARRRRFRPFAVGVAVALVAPLATSPLLSPINETADRFVFIGTLGGAIIAGTLGDRIARVLSSRARTVALVVVLLPFFVVARTAASAWKDDATLWRVATERAPTSARAFTGLARSLRLHGDLDGADRAIAHAIELDPNFLRARVTRLYGRLARGDVQGARADIVDIQKRGGGRQLGMRRAIRCAALSPEMSRRCAGGEGPVPPRVPATPGGTSPEAP